MDIQKADLKLIFEHTENKNTQEVIKGLKSLLEVEKEKGNLDFKVVTKRKCDYCNKILNEGDKFKTEKLEDGNIMDKCEECEKNGK